MTEYNAYNENFIENNLQKSKRFCGLRPTTRFAHNKKAGSIINPCLTSEYVNS